MSTLPNIVSILLAMAVTAYYGFFAVIALIISAYGGFGIRPSSVADGKRALLAAGFCMVPLLAAITLVYHGLLSPSPNTKSKRWTAGIASVIFLGYGIHALRFVRVWNDMVLPSLLVLTVVAFWIDQGINKVEAGAVVPSDEHDTN